MIANPDSGDLPSYRVSFELQSYRSDLVNQVWLFDTGQWELAGIVLEGIKYIQKQSFVIDILDNNKGYPCQLRKDLSNHIPHTTGSNIQVVADYKQVSGIEAEKTSRT